jgi:TfoX/Sxy family transcriptional regulator of competence genes
MPYDDILAERIRDYLEPNPEIHERKMFGGVAFMLRGNLAVGVSKDELMVRVGEAAHDQAVSEEGVRVFDLSGKRMKGWVLVGPEATAEDTELAKWIDTGLGFAGSLPPK